MTRHTITRRHRWGGGYRWLRQSFGLFWSASTDGIVYPLYAGAAMAMVRKAPSTLRVRHSGLSNQWRSDKDEDA